MSFYSCRGISTASIEHLGAVLLLWPTSRLFRALESSPPRERQLIAVVLHFPALFALSQQKYERRFAADSETAAVPLAFR